MCIACEMAFWIDEPPPVTAPKPKRKAAARADDAFACDVPEAAKPAARKRPASPKPRRKASSKNGRRP